jgi:tetratricopeptide (TPR) repeat protein
MYNLLISFGSCVIVFLLLSVVFGVPWWIAFLAAVTLFSATYLLIARYVTKKVSAIMEGAGRDIQGQRIEKAVRSLQEALRFGPWQISIAGQIHSQIGMIYYMKRDFSNAFSHLEKSFAKNWMAMGMLAISYMKRNKKEKMVATFEKAIQWSSKESLLWNLYAYCLNECGDTEKAIQVLEKGKKKLPGDDRLLANLEGLKTGKKMKMKSYGDMWLQFHLERQSVVMKQQAAALGGMARRRIIRK